MSEVATAGIEHGARALGAVSIAEALAFAQRQVRRLVTEAPGQFPTYTEQGRWVFGDDPWAPTWSGGFLAGLLWLFAERDVDPWWRDQAEQYSTRLAPRASDTNTHDVGFILEPSFGRWYDLSGSRYARDVLIEGGRTMARRLQRVGGYLSSWVDPGSTFIDIMMNVGIIFRAAQYTGDRSLRDIALRHSLTTRRYLLRGDGSTVHEAWFDTRTGEFLRAATHQGWRADSSWARGQSWAIYGFTSAYRHTGALALLDAARRTAMYYMEHTPESGVPPNDWWEPNPMVAREASAAAIAAAAMFQLADALEPASDAAHFRNYARRILATLCSKEFIAVDRPDWQGILQHATYHLGHGLGVDESVMFGDYYFVEALHLATR